MTSKCFKASLIASTFSAVGCFLGCFNSSTALWASYIGKPQTSFYLCYISGIYLEAIFSFYVFLYHFVGNSLFQLVRLSSFSNIIKQYFAISITKLHFYTDCAVRFCGKAILPSRALSQIPRAVLLLPAHSQELEN